MTEEERLNKYNENVFGEVSPKKKKVRKALDRAHEIRKFEIGLYWQRSLIFWGFILSFFTAYFLLFRSLHDETFSDGTSAYLILFGLSFLGLFTTVAWWFMERGARSWQKNWEYHIDFLEYAAGLNLYKTILGTRAKFFSPASIHRSVIFSVGLSWAVLSMFSACLVQDNKAICYLAEWPWWVIWVIAVVIFCCCIWVCIYPIKFCICPTKCIGLWRTSPETFGDEDCRFEGRRLFKRLLPELKYPIQKEED